MLQHVHVLEVIFDRLMVLPIDWESVIKLAFELWSSFLLRMPLNAPSIEPLFRESTEPTEPNMSVGRSSAAPEGTGGRGGRRCVDDARELELLLWEFFPSFLNERDDVLLDFRRRLDPELDFDCARSGKSGTAAWSSSATSISPIVSIKSSSDPKSNSSSSPNDWCSCACRTLERKLEFTLAGMVCGDGIVGDTKKRAIYRCTVSGSCATCRLRWAVCLKEGGQSWVEASCRVG